MSLLHLLLTEPCKHRSWSAQLQACVSGLDVRFTQAGHGRSTSTPALNFQMRRYGHRIVLLQNFCIPG